MKRVRFLIFILFSSILLCSQVSAQITAQVSSKKVAVGEQFEYAVIIAGSAGNYTQPNLKDFDIVSGPNQSSSVQIINGSVSQQMIFSYGLVARKEGKFVIPPASAVIGNQRVETTAITIEVVKGSATQSSQDPGYASDGSGNLFIRTGVSKNKCYIGEQITITQKVYSRLQIIGFQKFSQPTYDGFYSQALESTSKGVLSTENVDGINYYTYELFRTLAIANKAGKVTLTPIQGDIVVRRQTNAKPKNIFEQFFGAASYEDIPVGVTSRPLTIEVLPLPEAGKPENFSGAVGNFSSKVEVSRNQLKANEAFNLKLTITGKGNLKLLNAPTLELPEGFETYEPKAIENGNSKTFDYLIIPRSEGDYVLKNFEYSYFDLGSKKYVTLPSPEIKIKVLPPDPNNTGTQVYTPQNQVKETENDIRYIKKGSFLLTKNETEFFNSFTHILLLLIPVLGLIAGLIVRKNYIKNNSDIVIVRERKAARMAKKQLQNAERLMKANNKDEFYTEILTALNKYLSYKLNIPIADLSKESIDRALNTRSIEEATRAKLMSTLDTSEYAKYAPGAVSGDLQKVYRDTVELITGLEQQLNRKAA